MSQRRRSVWGLGLLLLSAVSLLGQEGTKDVATFLRRCQILGKQSKGNLTVVAVQGGEGTSLGNSVRTMDEVMPTGDLIIKEVDASGSVNTLALANRSNHFVFIMAGEILAGARQDRILQQDVLLPPHCKPVQIPAFCVEHGRWQTKSAQFYSEKVTAPLSVRQAAQTKEDQGEVWGEVARNNSKLGSESGTGSLSATYKKGKVLESRDTYHSALTNLPDQFPKATGVIVLVEGKVMAADLFGQRRLFERLWGKLLDSYIAEAIRRTGDKVPSEIATADDMLLAALRGSFKLQHSIGAGRKISISSSTVKGTGIELDGPVHLDLFPMLPETISRHMNGVNQLNSSVLQR